MPIRRPGVVTLLAVLHFISGGLLILIGLICIAAGLLPKTTDADGVLVTAGILFAALGGLQTTCGVGLWKLKSYGRTIQLVFSWLGLVVFPIGTILSIVVLVYLYKPGIKVLFSGKPVSQCTPDEVAQVLAVTQSSLGTVLAILALALAAVAEVGLIAAIAVAGSSRPRIVGNVGNEASAIGSLGAISMAQERYAEKCNGYAPDLLELKRAGDFIAGDLAVASIVSRKGYRISIEPAATSVLVTNARQGCRGSISDFFAHADPITVGSTGTRYFATDARGTIFQSTTPLFSPIASDATPVQ